jgi:hypothetical protein
VATKNWGGSSAHVMLGRAVMGRQADTNPRGNTFYGVDSDLALNKNISVLAEVFGSGPTDTVNPGSPSILRLDGMPLAQASTTDSVTTTSRCRGMAYALGAATSMKPSRFSTSVMASRPRA